MSTNLMIDIGAILILIIVGLILLLKREKKVQKLELDTSYLDQLFIALGGANNIVVTKIEHQRLQIKVQNIKNVNAGMLKELEIPAFVKGREITLLIKNHTQEVLSFLNDRRKEDN